MRGQQKPMIATPERPAFRPPAPRPRAEAPGLLTFLLALRRNPLTTWTERHFREKVISGEGILGRVMVVNDPPIIRHVLVDNAANYRKDDLQLRVLAPGLGRGLLTADGEEWRLQRRTIAPLFTPRTVQGFFPAMRESAERLVRRWQRRPDGRIVDVSLEMTRVTLDVLERTVFTTGISHNPDALGRAITRYFEGLGRIDPVDIFGLPAWVPRMIAARKALLGSGQPAPRDLLTLLLEASDPETGKGLSDLDVNANIVTFIGAGHETTANALSWSIYLISQDEHARARIEAEVDDVLGADAIEPAHLDRLVYTRAVLEEAMRLYPPVPFLSRAAIANDRAGDF
ncbi:MAG: cytochrome, partial [Microvirga sp.]|nr:cytochrome [Microvirga sp.]